MLICGRCDESFGLQPLSIVSGTVRRDLQVILWELDGRGSWGFVVYSYFHLFLNLQFGCRYS
jgi:hypothetical protein